MTPPASPPRLGLRGVLLCFCILAALLPALLLLPVAAGIGSRITESTTAEGVRTTGRLVASNLARGLFQQWREVEGLAGFVGAGGSHEALRQRLETVKSLNPQYAWLGLAAPDGRVQVATDGVLEAQSIGSRPWFKAGLQGPFAGDVHEAVLLQRILAPSAAEPMRLVDFAAPVRRADGVIAGVVGSHLNWDWVRELLLGTPLERGTDVLLVARDGRVLVGPSDLQGRELNLPSLLAARQSTAITTTETWPDGGRYFTAVVPTIGYRDLPGFGWSLIVRQPEAAAVAGARGMMSTLFSSLAATAALIIISGLMLAGYLSRPLRTLTAGAVALADGTPHGPLPDERRYREVAELSDAIARLHSRMTQRPAAVAPPARVAVPTSADNGSGDAA